jgi:hypothetical protein
MAWTSDRLAIFVMRRIVEALKRHPAVYDAVCHQLYSRLRSLNRRRIFRDAFQKAMSLMVSGRTRAPYRLRLGARGLETEAG